MIFKRLGYLLPWRRRAEEREMQAELAALATIAPRAELGNLTLAAEEARDAWGWGWLESAVADIRYACRVLLRERGFAAAAVLTLALAIGANLAIFRLMDALLWRQLPVLDPESLVIFAMPDDNRYSDFVEFQSGSGAVLSGLTAITDAAPRQVSTGPELAQAQVQMVSGSFFGLLGTGAALGRVLTEDDDRRGETGAAAVLSYEYWQRAYSGDPTALGKTMRIEKVPFTIVGIAPRDFFGVIAGSAPDVWIPLTRFDRIMPPPRLDDPHFYFLKTVGRLRPGVTVARAQQALTTIIRALPSGGPDSGVVLVPGANGLSALRERFSKPLHVVFAMVGIVLALAALNIMSLQLARADERRKELAVRLAIGAKRARVVRQLMTEACLLALAGGLLGAALSKSLAAALVTLVMAEDPLGLSLSLGKSGWLFAAAVSGGAAILFGALPAWRGTGNAIHTGVQQGSRTATSGRSRRSLGRAAVAVQLALSMVLLSGACLFAASLRQLTQFHTGIERDRLVVMALNAADAGYKGPAAAELNQRLLVRISGLPEVEAASFSGLGIFNDMRSNAMIRVDGYQPATRHDALSDTEDVGPNYFHALGASIIAGRDFELRDGSAAGLAIVNQLFAQHFFAGAKPVGRTLYRDNQTYRIIGLVEDIHGRGPRQTALRQAYFVRFENAAPRFLIRTKVRPEAVMSALREAVKTADPTLRIANLQTADDLLNRLVKSDWLIGDVGFAFGALALLLAGIGVYGLLAYDVTRRTSEIGIRVALGATRPSVRRLVLREAALVSLPGVAVGCAAALAAGKYVAALVFGLKASDPYVLGSAAVILGAVALAAAWIPARRAAAMDPMAALRHE